MILTFKTERKRSDFLNSLYEAMEINSINYEMYEEYDDENDEMLYIFEIYKEG